ncbi:MAG: SDR family NAD(P)-dependent oxidoreductase [Planctomycetota bacterium]
MQELREKVAVVTGAASGIGLALTEHFLAQGTKVVMADIEEATLESERKRLAENGARVHAVRCDVRSADDVAALRDEALSHFGAVHIVCNNAGVAPGGPMLETTPEDWRWIVDVNVLGVAYGITTFGPLLVEQGEGHIVNTASEAGLVTNTSLGMYCATKHAVVGMTEALYRELEPHEGVSTSVLCPNLVTTGIFHSERNRGDQAQETASQVATMAPLREALKVAGIAPAQVATNVADAIRENRFWIFTHAFTPQTAAKRFADIEANRNPSDPYAGVDLGLDLPEP